MPEIKKSVMGNGFWELNNLFYVWVKNVNKLRITKRTKGVCLSTPNTKNPTPDHQLLGKLPFVHLLTHTLSTFISTPIFLSINLLNSTYTHYPHPLLLEPPMKN